MAKPTKSSGMNRLEFLTPVMMVLMIASILVFIKVLPELPAIVDATEEFREDTEAIITPPPLPETDTSNVGITSPEIFEPEPPSGTKGEENVSEEEEQEPSGRSKTLAGIVDALIYILIAVIGGFGIYLLFKYRKRVTIKLMFGSLLLIVSAATCIFFGFMIYRMVDFKVILNWSDAYLITFLLIISAPVGALISYSIFSKRFSIKTRNFALLLVGALMGSFLAALLPLYGVIPLVVGISLFDIYSVRRGPIKKIMTLSEEAVAETDKVESEPSADPKTPGSKTEPEPVTAPLSEPKIESIEMKTMPGLTARPAVDDDSDLMLLYEAPDWSIGIGDFVIYSMFAAFVLTHTLQFLPYYGFYTPLLGFVIPWLVFLITTAGLLAGFTVTLNLLSKKPLLPGLPLAIFLGLSAFLGSLAVMQVLNFVAYGKFAPVL